MGIRRFFLRVLRVSNFQLNLRTPWNRHSLLPADRRPGMHQLIEDQDPLPLTPEDRDFLRKLRICAD